MFDVYFYEAFEEEAKVLKQYLPSHIRAGFIGKTIQEQQDEFPPAKLISIRTQSDLPEQWGGHLDAILTRSTGYDHIKNYQQKVKEALKYGYLPLYCNRAVAEQAMMLWMVLLRKLPRQIKKFNDFNRDGLTGFECERKNLAVMGVGNIGSEVAKIGMGLGMQVVGVDIIQKHDFVHYESVEKALSGADIIVCAMNLTGENMAYFSYARLKAARKGVVFVNIARGEMSPAADLLRLMREQHLGGLAMDVYNHESELAVALRSGRKSEDEEVKATLALSEYDNVIFTPHNAFNTEESVQRKAEQSVQQVIYYLENREFKWPVP